MTKHIGKERLTITMRKDVLASLDKFIDGKKIRNRSHAIEYIVGHYLGAGIDTCVILAAGKEEQSTSPLLRIQNRPVIAYTIELLRQAGIHKIILVTSGGRQDLQKYLGDGSQWKINITYIEDYKGTGTAHSLHLAKDYIKDTFILMYGDILIDIDIQEIVKFHKEQDDVISTMAVTGCSNMSLYGVTELQGSRVYRIIEKPQAHTKSNLVYSGMSVCEPSLLDYLDIKNKNYITRDVMPDLAHRGQVAGYPFTGKWFDISHPEEYELAQQQWAQTMTD
ncbi:MAG: sugar phosphate nucleotidyltransferase [bacterium]|nr:sugar phosphate nucleotidyltransferase [bacterium]